jgi:hypothetical protein
MTQSTPTPKLDPRTKQQIKLALEEAMYASTRRRFSTRLGEIVIRNTTACKFPHLSFSYKGEYYNAEATQLRFKNQRLMPELHSVMDALLEEQKEMEYTEKPYVIGFFNKVLNTSNSVLDYYELLPSVIHRAITALNIPPEFIFPRELTDEQVVAFQTAHQDWILKLKKRMILDLVIT